MKARTLLFALLVVVLASFSFTAMAQDVAREDTAIFDRDGRVGPQPAFDNYNLYLPNNLGNGGLGQAVLEPLAILNYETGEIMPWLAAGSSSNDSLDVWTLHLREGAEWSDGEAVDAEDVVFTFEMLLNPENAGLWRAPNVQTWVESIEAVDAQTVQFNLKTPNPRFGLDFLTLKLGFNILIMPEHIWADEDPFTFKNFPPVGSGPYTLTSANETTWVYDRNDDWWGAKTGALKMPEPMRLMWIITGNDQIRTSLAINNEVDSIMDVTLGAFEAMQANNDKIFAWVDGMPFVWLDPCARQLSFQTDVEPWDNPDMRWAINHIVDRDEIIAIAYEGVTIPSRTLFVEYGSMFPFIDAIEDAGMGLSSTSNHMAAEELLTANGYTRGGDGLWQDADGHVLNLSIQVHEGFIEKRRITSVLVEQLRAFGVNASAAVIAGPTWDDNKRFGNYEATTDWDSCGSINEPWASMDRYSARHYVPIGERSSGANHVRWSGMNNEAYSEIVEQIGALPLGDPQIIPLVLEAYQYIYEDLPFLPLNQATKLIPFNSTYWEGWPTTENNFNHPATWWQSTHQIISELRKAGS
jgi:peptide/nickel transport system substrate-binding protein